MLAVCVCVLAQTPAPQSSPRQQQPSGPKPANTTSSQGTPGKATKKKPAQRKPTSGKPVRSTRARRSSPRFRRIHQAFIASSTLKPMALQLLQNRTPAAYAGVEAYAHKHSAEDAGSLAWLTAGYAYFLDRQFAKAIDALDHAKAHAGEFGDYVAYYLASSETQSGRASDAINLLSKFDENFPESLLTRDARVLYADALISANRAREAVPILEKDREPIRADLELTLGRAYAASGDPAKAVAVQAPVL